MTKTYWSHPCPHQATNTASQQTQSPNNATWDLSPSYMNKHRKTKMKSYRRWYKSVWEINEKSKLDSQESYTSVHMYISRKKQNYKKTSQLKQKCYSSLLSREYSLLTPSNTTSIRTKCMYNPPLPISSITDRYIPTSISHEQKKIHVRKKQVHWIASRSTSIHVKCDVKTRKGNYHPNYR